VVQTVVPSPTVGVNNGGCVRGAESLVEDRTMQGAEHPVGWLATGFAGESPEWCGAAGRHPPTRCPQPVDRPK